MLAGRYRNSPKIPSTGYEMSAERWSPVQSVEKILLSVVSMLAGMYRNSQKTTSSEPPNPSLAANPTYSS